MAASRWLDGSVSVAEDSPDTVRRELAFLLNDHGFVPETEGAHVVI